MSYDSAGNLITDTYSGAGSRVYNAENKMTKAWGGANQWQEYTYNAEGQRVRRKIDGVETWQMYGMDGELLAEYSQNGAPSSPQKEYGYRNGQLLITAESAAQIKWLVADHLGTPRMIFDKSGSLANVKRHDYLPFGEELFAGVGGRTTGNGYTGDADRQKFTSKERDNETGLDYSINRYYSSTPGRFTGVDPMMASAKLSNPQTMNRYVYVINNPLRYIDPNGLDAEDPWSSLTKKEQLLLAPKLTTVQDGYVPNQKQLEAAGKAFNEKVKALTKDGLDVKQTMINVASVKAFVAQLGSNKQAWAQVDKIGQVQAQGEGEVAGITFTVKNDDAFIGALKADPSYRYREKDAGHTDSFRLRTVSAEDPSFHIDRDGATFGSHWDPTSTFNLQSQEQVMNGVLTGNPMGIAAGVAEMGSAGARHWGGKATVEQVQKFLTPSKQ